jgi:hypothetical protein
MSIQNEMNRRKSYECEQALLRLDTEQRELDRRSDENYVLQKHYEAKLEELNAEADKLAQYIPFNTN